MRSTAVALLCWHLVGYGTIKPAVWHGAVRVVDQLLWASSMA
jgi:hypothetical protein